MVETNDTIRATERQARHLALLEGASNGVLLVDLETATIVDCNSAAHTKLGYSREELLGLGIHNIAPNLPADNTATIFSRIKTKGYEHFESTHRTKQGNPVRFRVTGNLIHFNNKLFGQYILYEIANYDRRTKSFEKILEEISSLTGEQFFSSLSTHIGETLSADYVCIGIPCNDSAPAEITRLNLIATYGRDQFIEPFEYDLSETPCERTIIEGTYTVASGVCEQFPNDELLTQMGVDGYVGISLKRPPGSSLGLIATLFKKPIENVDEVLSTVKIFALRAITELDRWHTEIELHRHEQIVAHASDLLAFVKTDCSIQSANPAFRSIFAEQGKSDDPKASSDKWDAKILSGKLRPYLDECFNGNEVSAEFILAKTSPEERNIEFKISPSLDSNGKISGAVVCGRDITKLKHAELDQTLRANILEAMSKASSLDGILTEIILLAESHSPGILGSIFVVDDKKNQLVYGAGPSLPEFYRQGTNNLPIERGTGCCGEAAYCKKRVIASDIANHPNWASLLDLCQRAGLASCWSEPILNSRNGVLGTFAIYYREPREPSSYDIKLIVSLANITSIAIENLKAQENQSRLQNQLRQSQKMEAIGQLTGGIAHDFNNILGSILGFAGLALNRCIGKSDLRLKNYLTEIQQAGERARDLIAQMLTFSRTGLNQPKSVTVSPLVDESVRLLRPLLPSSIDLSTHIDCENATIYADKVQIQQVIINLCINSRDAMEGKGSISLDTRQLKLVKRHCASCHATFQGEFIEFRFKDSGCGVATHMIERMFEPFFTTKEIGKGTGMGLAMVHGIVHQYLGHITVNSIPEKGTTVCFYLPIHEVDESEKIREKEYRSSTAPHSPGAHILVVDDEAPLAKLLTETLEDIGYRITATTSSQTALELYLKGPYHFDLVITDQTMPNMTGLELAQAMLILRHDLPIILCTGYSSDVDPAKIKKAGITQYFQKPIDTNTLLKSIDRVLSKNKKLH